MIDESGRETSRPTPADHTDPPPGPRPGSRPGRSRRLLRFSRPARAVAAAAALGLIVPMAVFGSAQTALACPSGGCPTRPPAPTSKAPVPTPPPPTQPPPTHIVVSSTGDSYASGDGAGGYLPQDPTNSSFWRHVSPYAPSAYAFLALETSNKPATGSYPISENSMMTAWLGDKLNFGASSGATTFDVDQTQVDSDTGDPRNQPQIDYVAANSNLVYYQLGGNNAGFGRIVKSAIVAYLSQEAIGYFQDLFTPFGTMPADWKSYQEQAVQNTVNEETATLPAMQTQIEANLAEIHAKAGQAGIIVSLYPVGVQAGGNPDINMVAGGTLDKIYSYATQLNSAVRAAVVAFNAANPNGPGVQIFDPNTAGPGGTSVTAGHEAGTADPYFNGVTFDATEAGLLHELHAFQESFHPNREGDIAVGQALATFTHVHFPSLYPSAPTFYQIQTTPQSQSDSPTPAQMFPLLNGLMTTFCGYAPNQDIAGCQVGSGNGDGGTIPIPPPDSPAFEALIGDLLAAVSGDGSTGTDADGNGTTSGGSGDGGSTGSTDSGGWTVVNVTHEGTAYKYVWAGDHWQLWEWGGTLTGPKIIDFVPGVQPSDAPPRPAGAVPDATTTPDESDTPPNGDPITDPSTTSSSGDGSQATSGDSGTGDGDGDGSGDGDGDGGGDGGGGSCDEAVRMTSHQLSRAQTDAQAGSDRVFGDEDGCEPD